jgi:hypothetical protein
MTDILDLIAMWTGYVLGGALLLYLLLDLWIRVHFVLCHALASVRAAWFLGSRVYWLRFPLALWRDFLETYKPWSRDGMQWSKNGRTVHWTAPTHVWSLGTYDFREPTGSQGTNAP